MKGVKIVVGVKVKCNGCKTEYGEKETLTIKGKANVEGETSIKRFNKEGVVWETHDSWDEVWVCPNCGAENEIWSVEI